MPYVGPQGCFSCSGFPLQISDFSSRPWRNLPRTWVIHMAARKPAYNTPIQDFLYGFLLKSTKSMWIGVLWAGLRVAMWITHVGGKFRNGLLEKLLSRVSRKRECDGLPPAAGGFPKPGFFSHLFRERSRYVSRTLLGRFLVL